MSWKDVRKNAKDSSDGAKGEGIDESLEDGADGECCIFLLPCSTDASPLEQNTAKPKKRIVKLSWEITTIYSDVIKTLAANHGRHTGHSDDEDEDEMEAHEDSVKRLRVCLLRISSMTRN